jgi:excisionase family DNA binding protein
MEDLPEFLTVSEAALYLGLNRETVYEMIRRGALPNCRVGRTLRVPKSRLTIEPM